MSSGTSATANLSLGRNIDGHLDASFCGCMTAAPSDYCFFDAG